MAREPRHRPDLRQAPVPGRRLRLLAGLALPAAVVFGLLTLVLLTGTLRALAWPLTFPGTVSVVLGAWATLLCAVITYRLGFEAPRVSRGWEEALTERTRVLREARTRASVGP